MEIRSETIRYSKGKSKELKEQENVIQGRIEELDLGDLLSNQQDIFLISNHFPGNPKWDFKRLTSAILEALPRYQRERESLTLTLTHLSANIVKQKVDILKSRT